MIGVVIWSNEVNRKAVIWCEDHGPLAYLRGCDGILDEADWPATGDMLRMECEVIGNLRHAHSVSVIAPKVCSHLPNALLDKQTLPTPRLRLVANNDSMGQHARINQNDENKAFNSLEKPNHIQSRSVGP